jgi:hypothetical protein
LICIDKNGPGGKIWGSTTINNGQTRSINKNVDFTGSVSFQLRHLNEAMVGTSRHFDLINLVIKADDVYDASGNPRSRMKRTAEFKGTGGFDYHYYIRYEIAATPGPVVEPTPTQAETNRRKAVEDEIVKALSNKTIKSRDWVTKDTWTQYERFSIKPPGITLGTARCFPLIPSSYNAFDVIVPLRGTTERYHKYFEGKDTFTFPLRPNATVTLRFSHSTGSATLHSVTFKNIDTTEWGKSINRECQDLIKEGFDKEIMPNVKAVLKQEPKAPATGTVGPGGGFYLADPRPSNPPTTQPTSLEQQLRDLRNQQSPGAAQTPTTQPEPPQRGRGGYPRNVAPPSQGEQQRSQEMQNLLQQLRDK